MQAEVKKLLIEVDLDDKSKPKIKQVGDNVKEVSKQSQEAGGNLVAAFTKGNLAATAIQKSLEFVGKSIKGIVSGTIELTKQFTKLTIDLSERSGAIQDITSGFEKNFKNTEVALKDLRKAAQGTISDFDLMLSANKAALLGVSADSKELADLLEIARGRAQALGTDSTSAFEDIVTGIGRMSPLILDNLGITTAAYKTQLAAIEDTGKELSDQEKKQLLLKTVLEDNSVAVTTITTLWQQFRASLINTRDTIAQGLSPIFQEIGETVMPFVTNAMTIFSEKVLAFAQEVWPVVKEAAVEWRDYFKEWWQENDTVILEQVKRLQGALFGDDSDSLWGALKNLINPTEEEKAALGEFVTNGVEKVVDALIGKKGDGGLIGSLNTMIQTFDDFDSEYFYGELNKILTIVDAVAWTIDKLTEAWQGWLIITGKSGKTVKRVGVDESVNAAAAEARRAYEAETIGFEGTIPIGAGINLPQYQSNQASGGITTGGMTLVGEAGPEIVSLPRGSHVYNNQDSQRMMSSGDIVINVNAPVTGVDNLKATILEAVNEATARQNRLAKYNLL